MLKNKSIEAIYLGCPAGNDDNSSRDATCDDLRIHYAWMSKSPDAVIAASLQQCQPVCHRSLH